MSTESPKFQGTRRLAENGETPKGYVGVAQCEADRKTMQNQTSKEEFLEYIATLVSADSRWTIELPLSRGQTLHKHLQHPKTLVAPVVHSDCKMRHCEGQVEKLVDKMFPLQEMGFENTGNLEDLLSKLREEVRANGWC